MDMHMYMCVFECDKKMSAMRVIVCSSYKHMYICIRIHGYVLQRIGHPKVHWPAVFIPKVICTSTQPEVHVWGRKSTIIFITIFHISSPPPTNVIHYTICSDYLQQWNFITEHMHSARSTEHCALSTDTYALSQLNLTWKHANILISYGFSLNVAYIQAHAVICINCLLIRVLYMRVCICVSVCVSLRHLFNFI